MTLCRDCGKPARPKRRQCWTCVSRQKRARCRTVGRCYRCGAPNDRKLNCASCRKRYAAQQWMRDEAARLGFRALVTSPATALANK